MDKRIIVALCLAAGLSGCGKPQQNPTGTVLVSMADNSFSPAIVRVPVGGSILFMNTGRNDHNVTAVDKSWSSEKTFGNIKMNPDDMTEIVIGKEGVYPFYCSFHATPDGKTGMVGVAVVGNIQYTPPSGHTRSPPNRRKIDGCHPPRATRVSDHSKRGGCGESGRPRARSTKGNTTRLCS